MTTDKNHYSVESYCDLDNRKLMSPSSWDDSEEEEEFTDTSSTLGSSDLKEIRSYDSSVTNEALDEEEDRRQSSARVRRRKKDSTETSLALPETDVSSFIGNSFVALNDRDTEGVILDVEIYLNERNFSHSFPKVPGCIFPESGTWNAINNDRLIEISEETKNVRNLNLKLSRTVEVDESRSNLCLGSTDNPHSITANRHEEPGAKTNLTCGKGSEAGDEEIAQSDENNGNDVEIFTGNKKTIKNAMRSTTRNNFNDAYYQDGTEYFENSLMYFFEALDAFDKSQKTRSSNYEEVGLCSRGQISTEYLESTAKIEGNELFQSFREINSVGGRNDAGDKISIDKVEDVSNCTETTHESGTPRRHGNLTGREKDHALSKESLDLELENPFSVTRPTSSVPSTSNNDHDTLLFASYDLMHNNECLLKDMSLSLTDADNFSRFLTRSEDSNSKTPELSRIINRKITADLLEISSGGRIGLENEDSKSEALFEILRKYPSDSTCLFGNGAKVDQMAEGSIRSHNKSKSYSENVAILELDASDKSSTTERKIYGDSFSDIGDSVTSESAKNNGNSPSSVIRKLPTTGEASPTRSDATDDAPISNRNRFPPSKSDKFGFGDFAEWNTVRNASERTDYPQDRGDMKFESYSVKSEWGRLIVQLDKRCRINRPVQSVYRVGVRDNLQSDKGENAKPVQSLVKFRNRSAKGTGGAWKITKAKKRKRGIAFADDYVTGVTPNNANRVIKENWLINTLTSKGGVLWHGTGSFKTFLVTRGRGKNDKRRSYGRRGPTSHFVYGVVGSHLRTLFRRLVNFFTVFCPKNRN